MSDPGAADRARIYAYANPFAPRYRIEVLVDWSDAVRWPETGWLDWLQGEPQWRVRVVAAAAPPAAGDFSGAGFEWRCTTARFLTVNRPMANPPNAATTLRRRVWEEVWAKAGTIAPPEAEFEHNYAQQVGRLKPRQHEAPHFFFHSPAAGVGSAADRSDMLHRQAVLHAASLLAARDHAPQEKAARQARSAQDGANAGVPAGVSALRTLCRDEPTLGHLFGVLVHLEPLAPWGAEWVPWLQGGQPLWLLAAPPGREDLRAFPTRLGVLECDAGGRLPVTLLQEPRRGAAMVPVPHYDSLGAYARTFAPESVVAARLLSGEPIAASPDAASAESAQQLAASRRSLAPLLNAATLRRHARDMMGKAPKLSKVPTQPEIAAHDRWAQAVESVVHAVHSLQAARPRFDAVGLRWQFPPPADADGARYHRGLKGYRIDVQTAGEPGWQSLCLLRRTALDGDGLRAIDCVDGCEPGADLVCCEPREGYVHVPLQQVPAGATEPLGVDGKPAAGPPVVAVPLDFVVWSGGSVCRTYPLDRVGRWPRQSGAAAALPLQLEDQLVAGTPLPRYGRRYRFAARGVGLGGLGPGVWQPGWETADPDPRAAEASWIDFVRTIPMAAPEVAARLPAADLRPLVGTQEAPDGADHQAPAVYEALRPEARLHLKLVAPVAHYKVALHALGVDDDDARPEVRAAFEEACNVFARRVADASQGAAPTSPADQSTAALSALDPHAAGMEVTSEIWYPFSDGAATADRFVVVGRRTYAFDDLRHLPFTRLVVEGEKLVGGARHTPCGDYCSELSLPLALEGGVRGPQAEVGEPCLPLGVRARVSSSGVWRLDGRQVSRWSGSAECGPGHAGHGVTADGLERWGLALTVLYPPRRVPLGGAVGQPGENEASVCLRYGGLAEPAHEEILALPPGAPPPPGAPGGAPPPGSPPAGAPPPPGSPPRGALCDWRRFAFSDPAPGDHPLAGDLRAAYTAFLGAMLGGRFAPAALETAPLCVAAMPASYTLTLDGASVPVIPAAGGPQGLADAIVQAAGAAALEVKVVPAGDDDSHVKLRIAPAGPAIRKIKLEAVGVAPPVPGATAADSCAVSSLLIDASFDTLRFRIAPRPLPDGRVTFAAAAVSFDSPATVEETPDGSVVSLGSFGAADGAPRRLPFVDDRATHIVRLSWRIPLRSDWLERPRDLAAVRELRLYRTEQGVAPDLAAPPRATITRPSDAVFQGGSHHLDEVEWVWLDAADDLDAHTYDYHVVAVPDHPEAFAGQTWWVKSVTIPASRIDPRPQRVVALPMLAGKCTERRVAVSLPADASRLRQGCLAVRLVAAVNDPLLLPAVSPAAEVPTPPQLPPAAPGVRCDSFARPRLETYKPDSYSDLFPAHPFKAEPVFSVPKKPAGEGWFWAAAEPVPADAAPAAAPVTLLAAAALPAALLQCPGNPFFKLQARIYAHGGYPRLPQAVASDILETDWLQFYPEDLAAVRLEGGKLAVDAGVKGGSLRYRFHCFAGKAPSGTSGPTPHVASFLRREARLDMYEVLSVLANTPWLSSVAEVVLRTVVEEGFLFGSYRDLGTPDGMASVDRTATSDAIFVPLRTSTGMHEIVLRRPGAGGGFGVVTAPG
jgi:hypothetical protein